MTHPSNLKWWHFWCQGRNQAFLAWVEILFYVFDGIPHIVKIEWGCEGIIEPKTLLRLRAEATPIIFLPLRQFCWLFICGCVLCQIELWEEGKSFSLKHVCRITIAMLQVCEFQNDYMYNWPGKWWSWSSHDHLEIFLHVLLVFLKSGRKQEAWQIRTWQIFPVCLPKSCSGSFCEAVMQGTMWLQMWR